jgi:hypothetical protein
LAQLRAAASEGNPARLSSQLPTASGPTSTLNDPASTRLPTAPLDLSEDAPDLVVVAPLDGALKRFRERSFEGIMGNVL